MIFKGDGTVTFLYANGESVELGSTVTEFSILPEQKTESALPILSPQDISISFTVEVGPEVFSDMMVELSDYRELEAGFVG